MEYSKRQKAIILYLSNRQKLSAMEVPGKQIADHLTNFPSNTAK